MQRNAAALASAKEPCVVLHDEIKSIQSTGIRCKGQLVALKRRATLGSGTQPTEWRGSAFGSRPLQLSSPRQYGQPAKVSNADGPALGCICSHP